MASYMVKLDQRFCSDTLDVFTVSMTLKTIVAPAENF